MITLTIQAHDDGAARPALRHRRGGAVSAVKWCGSTGTDTSPNPGWDGPRWRVVPDTGLGYEEWDPTMTADEERAWYGNQNLIAKRCDFTTGQHRHRSDEPCAGLDQRDPEALLYGLVGGPGARDLPDPVEDVRTETRAVGW